jgi:hypothetical protein
MATAWVPAAVGVGVTVLVLLAIWLRYARSARDGPDEADGSDDEGGLRVGLPPRRPPPAGPVCWPEFEREFAEYVARRHERSPAGARTGADDAGST